MKAFGALKVMTESFESGLLPSLRVITSSPGRLAAGSAAALAPASSTESPRSNLEDAVVA